MKRPSGDHDGPVAPSVPAICNGTAESRRRIHNVDAPDSARAAQTMRLRSGEGTAGPAPSTAPGVEGKVNCVDAGFDAPGRSHRDTTADRPATMTMRST